MKPSLFLPFAAIMAIVFEAADPAAGQVLDRKTQTQNRKAVVDFAARHGTLIKGMTKGEVLKIYGRPDKRFTYSAGDGRVEHWTYYFPRKRSIVPWRNSQFSGRFRFLYFKDDILVNFER